MVPPWFAAPLRPQRQTNIRPAEDNGRIPSPPTCHTGFNGKLQGEFHRQAVSPLSAYTGLSGHRHDPATRLDHRFCGIIISAHKDCQAIHTESTDGEQEEFIIRYAADTDRMSKPLRPRCHSERSEQSERSRRISSPVCNRERNGKSTMPGICFSPI